MQNNGFDRNKFLVAIWSCCWLGIVSSSWLWFICSWYQVTLFLGELFFLLVKIIQVRPKPRYRFFGNGYTFFSQSIPRADMIFLYIISTSRSRLTETSTSRTTWKIPASIASIASMHGHQRMWSNEYDSEWRRWNRSWVLMSGRSVVSPLICMQCMWQCMIPAIPIHTRW